jgi:hypothetical protein
MKESDAATDLGSQYQSISRIFLSTLHTAHGES